MIVFQGDYLNTQDPPEAAFIRSSDYFQRGMIVEQLDAQAVPQVSPVPRSSPGTWAIASRDPLHPSTPSPAPPPTPYIAPMPLKRPAPKHDRATAWLKTILHDGRPLLAAWMLQQATQARISLRTLGRARMTLGVITTKEGMTGGWAWSLSPDSHGRLR